VPAGAAVGEADLQVFAAATAVRLDGVVALTNAASTYSVIRIAVLVAGATVNVVDLEVCAVRGAAGLREAHGLPSRALQLPGRDKRLRRGWNVRNQWVL
jgi:hypothetical protein